MFYRHNEAQNMVVGRDRWCTDVAVNLERFIYDGSCPLYTDFFV